MTKLHVSFFSRLLLIGFAGCFLAACSHGPDNSGAVPVAAVSDSTRIDSLTHTKKEVIEFKFAILEANLPSPFEMVNDICSYKVPYNADLLNPYTNAGQYVSAYKKAVNYGVYGVDLAYANFYGQNQDLLNYYTATQKLAKELNIDAVFDPYVSRLRASAGNKDSIITIVDDAFSGTDAYLKKNERFLTASHILAGALIEVNYLSLNNLKNIKHSADNAQVYEKVYNERLYIDYLIKLFGEYTDKDSKDLLAAMQAYDKSYISTIKSADDLTPDNINKATGMISDLRNKLIK